LTVVDVGTLQKHDSSTRSTVYIIT